MRQLSYQTFDVEIGPAGPTGYPTAVLNSPGGQGRATLALPADADRFRRQVDALHALVPAAPSADAVALAEEMGTLLFDALLHDDLLSLYDVSRALTDAAGEGLRLRLRIQAPELTTLAWEFLYDPRQKAFLGRSRVAPLVRYLEVGTPERPFELTPPLRVLAIAASPAGLPPLDVAGEQRRVERAVAPLVAADKLDLHWLEPPTWRALQGALQQGPWHVLHFVGHAEFDLYDGKGSLVLADDDGGAMRLSAVQLADLLVDQRTLRLAVLNACQGAQGDAASVFSSIAATLVQRGLAAVIAMQYLISDGAALEFSGSFYQALAAFLPVDGAVAEARKAISLAEPDTLEWATPVLYLRTPDGALFRQPEEATMTQESQQTPPSPQPWWDKLPEDFGTTDVGDVSGDVIIARVGSGARNVAVGKNITQQIYEAVGAPEADDGAAVAAQFAALQRALLTLQGTVDDGKLKEGEYQLRRLEEELSDLPEDEAPRGRTVMQAGDWLLDNLPDLTAALAELFGMAAVGRILSRAGSDLITWARDRFG